MPSSNALKPALASALGHSRSPSTSSITSVASDAVLIPTPQPAQTTSPLGPSVNQVDIYSGLPPLLVPKPQQETVQQREHVNGESDDDAGGANSGTNPPETVFGSMSNNHKLDIRYVFTHKLLLITN